VADWDSVLADAETFLEKVIRDNSIGYSDDWNKRRWSFIYYLNNARFRLKELADSWPEFKAKLTSTDFEWLNKPMVGSYSLHLWEQHCGTLQTAIWMLGEAGAE
jgi:hypothetical protein